jgi:hypothetical protein
MMQGRMVDMTDKEWLVRNLNKGSKDFLHLAKKVNNLQMAKRVMQAKNKKQKTI